MFEDVVKNLVVPKAKGMTTVLVTAKRGQPDHREFQDRLNYIGRHRRRRY